MGAKATKFTNVQITGNLSVAGTTTQNDQILADTTVATNKKLQFRDTGIYLQSGADGKLTIAADGSGADDITLSGTVTLGDDLTVADGKQVKPDGGTASATGGAATLSKQSGVVTSESLTTAAGAAYTLTLTNTLIATTSIVLASVANGTNSQGKLALGLITPGSGSCTIEVRNDHGSQALNGTIKISFLVLNPA